MSGTTTGRRKAAPTPVKAGLVLGGFRLVELIGEGGMGSVWRAENERVRSMVRAVKVVKPELAAIPDFRTRFLREAEYLEALQHPNILLVQNIAEQDGVLFMLMEHLQGQPLDQLVTWSPGKLPPADVAGLVQQALIGVAHAHARGIVHRDLKPQNLFLTQAGVVKVLDFGIARADDATTQLTRVGGVAPGSPAYLAPEIAHGEPATPRSDVYAMGITLFELLAGKLPFAAPPGTTDSQAALSIMFQHATKPLPDLREQRPEVPEGLLEALRRATAKTPPDRFADAGEFARELAPYAGVESALNLARLTPAPGLVVSRGATPARLVPMGSGADGGSTRFEVPALPVEATVGGDHEATRGGGKRWGLVVGALLAVGASAGAVLMIQRAKTTPLKPGETAKTAAAAAPALVPVPPGMVALPGGELAIGRDAYDAEGALDVPRHAVSVQPFAIQKAEVTVAEYKEYVEAGHARAPWPPVIKDFSVLGKLPVVGVDQQDASDYCVWRFRGRLPTEQEWEWAARGAGGRLYPWGDDFRRVCVNGLHGEAGTLLPSDKNPCGATPEGVLDLSGNAWEWTASKASVYPGSPLPPPPDGLWVIRGGSFFNEDPNQLTGTVRQFARAPSRFIGFRCVVESGAAQ